MRPLRLLFFAGVNAAHTTRWVNAMAERGHQIKLVSCRTKLNNPLHESVSFEFIPLAQGTLGYVFGSLWARKIHRRFNPELTHVQRSSGYGLIASQIKCNPYVLSVWGSDVYTFPYQSPLHRIVTQRNLRQANIVCSTSKVMAEQVRTVCPDLPDLRVTPFGVDLRKFRSMDGKKTPGTFTIGTVKLLQHKYGIDTLIQGFATFVDRFAQLDIADKPEPQLVIAGDGPDEDKLKALVASLGVADRVTFLGRVPHDHVPEVLATFDIYVALSRLECESFGVAVIEASACCLPVIVSDVGGFKEVVDDSGMGMIIPRESPDRAADAMLDLFNNPDRRKRMGELGRQRVEAHYDWAENVSLMESIYSDALRH